MCFVGAKGAPYYKIVAVVLLYRGLAVVWDPSDPAVDDAPHPSATSFAYKDGIRELAASLRFFSIYGFDVPTPLVVTYPTPVAGPADVLEQTPVFTTVSGDGTVSASAIDLYVFCSPPVPYTTLVP